MARTNHPRVPDSFDSSENVAQVLSSISDFLKEGDLQEQQTSEQERVLLLALAQRLVATLESPQEANVRITWREPTTAAALRLLLEYNVFSHIVGKNENESPKTKATDLAIKCGDKHGLIPRLLKHVATSSFVREVGPDEYVPTALTWHFSKDINAG